MWLHFSEWLIAAGPRLRRARGDGAPGRVPREPCDPHAAGSAGRTSCCSSRALVVELFNAFVHTIDGWTAVVPTGMTLSIVGAILALAAAGTLFRVPVTWVARREVMP